MPINQSSPWIIVSSPISHAEFTTHSNYLKCLCHLSSGLSVATVNIATSSNALSTLVRKKKILIDLTKNNLDSELSQVNRYIDYSQICISWVPVKSYYLFFNLLIVLMYLISDDAGFLTMDHGTLHRRLKDFTRSGNLTFNVSSFNTIHVPNRILSWRIPIGNNVIVNRLNFSNLEKQVIKKMFFYAKEEYKRTQHVDSLRGAKKQRFLTSTTINLCEFFYWYRLKANYRDMEFVNSQVSTSEFHSFYTDYYNLTINFFNALKTEINRLSQVRFQQQVL